MFQPYVCAAGCNHYHIVAATILLLAEEERKNKDTSFGTSMEHFMSVSWQLPQSGVCLRTKALHSFSMQSVSVCRSGCSYELWAIR